MTRNQIYFMAAWLFGVLLLFSCDTTHAQVADMRPTVNSVLDYTANTLALVLSVLGGFAIRFFNARTGLINSEMEASLSARLNDILHRGIEYALTAAKNEVNKPGSGLEAVKFDNYFLSLAASYVNRAAPDILNRFQITQARLEELIMARMPGYANLVPVTGALPAPAGQTLRN